MYRGSAIRFRNRPIIFVSMLLVLALFPLSGATSAETTTSAPDTPWGDIPMWFTPMPAIFESGPQFEALGATGHFTFDTTGYTFTANRLGGPPVGIRMQFELGRAQALQPAVQLTGVVNDLRGSDASAWQRNVPTYARLLYRGLYPGIDLQYDGRPGRLKGLYTVMPGADPANIQWRYDGAADIELKMPNGELWVRLGEEGEDTRYLISGAPIAWQEIDAAKIPVTAAYEVSPDGRISFALGRYDETQPLIIDPYLSYAVVAGGSGADEGRAIAVDAGGNAYVTGTTFSTDFPQAGLPQQNYGGTTSASFGDAFVMKLNPTGKALVYMTYLGGTGGDIGDAIAVNAQGEVFVTGATTSPNFPVQNALQPAPGGQTCAAPPCADAFVVKLNAAGNGFVFSTYLGGNKEENTSLVDTGTLSTRAGIAVDASGRIYVSGRTDSTNFPTVNPAQANLAGLADLFLSVLSPNGQTLLYSTYLGGTGADYAGGVSAGSEGKAAITGGTLSSNFPTKNAYQATNAGIPDAVVAAFDTTKVGAASLLFSTYLGGAGADQGFGVAMNVTGVHVSGFTQSTNFPTKNGFQLTNASAGSANPYDAMVATLGSAGNTLLYGSYLGGGGYDVAYSLAANGQGDLFVAGRTNSTNFPLRQAWQGARGSSDVILARIRPSDTGTNSLIYSTYLGGTGADYGYGVAVGSENVAYVAGVTGGATAGTIPANIIGPNGASSGVLILKLHPNLARVYLPLIRR